MDDLRLTINKIIRNFDEEDLSLVYSFVKRLGESYEDYESAQTFSEKSIETIGNKNKVAEDKTERFRTDDVPSTKLDYSSDELLEDYGFSGNEELLERLMMWRRD